MAEAERPRGGSEQNDSLTGGGGGARRPVPVSPDTAPARTVSSDTSLVSACGSRRDSIVACAGSRSRHLDTRATHSAASSLPWKAMREGDGDRGFGLGVVGQLDRRRAGPPGRVRSPRFGNRARQLPNRDHPALGGDFFFSAAPARAVTPMRNKIRPKTWISGRTKKNDRSSLRRTPALIVIPDERSEIFKVNIKVSTMSWTENQISHLRSAN
jgi:hypothetical protein